MALDNDPKFKKKPLGVHIEMEQWINRAKSMGENRDFVAACNDLLQATIQCS